MSAMKSLIDPDGDARTFTLNATVLERRLAIAMRRAYDKLRGSLEGPRPGSG